jgi:FkbM family methyltransferase
MPAVEHIKAIDRLAPASLIDIGANKGQFSLIARYLFPEIVIHAFEPLEDERKVFYSVIGDPVDLHSMAVGAESGQAVFFVASRKDSSSLLKPSVAQKSAYGVNLLRSIQVPVGRLSDILDVSELPRPILVKLDVQGSELDVLKGADSVLRCAKFIYCEVSFVRLYEDQPLANNIIGYLESRGFELKGVFNQSITQEFGPTQADFLFQAVS